MTDDRLDLIFKALSDSTRRRIIERLSNRPGQSLFEVCATSLAKDGIPAHSFQVTNLEAERKRLGGKGVEFVQEPMDAGPVRMAVFNDTCGNLIQLIEMKDAAQG
ncbi:MAG: VOC family protein [Pseudomonadota bacterium]